MGFEEVEWGHIARLIPRSLKEYVVYFGIVVTNDVIY